MTVRNEKKRRAGELTLLVGLGILAIVVLVAVGLEGRLTARADSAPGGVFGESPRVTDTDAHAAARNREDPARSNFLVLGRDRAAGLSDAFMLVCCDTDAHTVHVVQIPRDTYAAYTTRNYRKINGAYTALGIEKLMSFVSETFCVEVDHYVVVDTDALRRVVDILGGVEVNVPAAMDYEDPAQGLSIHLPAGRQTLDGAAAEEFVRYRSGYVQADLGRMDTQKIFLSALAKQVRENATTADLLRIVSASLNDVKTDLTLPQCLELARALVRTDLSNVTFLTLAGEDVRSGKTRGAWYYVVNRAAALDTVNEYLNLRDTPVTDAEFDPHHNLSRTDYEHFEEIYNKEAASPRVFTATEINENGIGIPRVGER